MPVNLFVLSVLLVVGVVGGIAIMPEETPAGAGMADLPHAEGQRFATLDAYLAHLEKLGAYDIAWYRRLPDGRYRLIRRSAPGTAPQIFTRQELLERFGFSE